MNKQKQNKNNSPKPQTKKTTYIYFNMCFCKSQTIIISGYLSNHLEYIITNEYSYKYILCISPLSVRQRGNSEQEACILSKKCLIQIMCN